MRGSTNAMTVNAMPKTSRQSATRVYYQQINNKTYLCWGWNEITVQYATVNQKTITYPITPDGASNVFPVISLLYNGGYWADIQLNAGNRTTSGFTVQSFGMASGMGTINASFTWMAVITTA